MLFHEKWYEKVTSWPKCTLIKDIQIQQSVLKKKKKL